jgi:hypothetical protein
MQMRDNGDAIELTAELPGIEPDKVKVELADDMLTISGEAEAREEREDERIERHVSFYRQIAKDRPRRLIRWEYIRAAELFEDRVQIERVTGYHLRAA